MFVSQVNIQQLNLFPIKLKLPLSSWVELYLAQFVPPPLPRNRVLLAFDQNPSLLQVVNETLSLIIVCQNARHLAEKAHEFGLDFSHEKGTTMRRTCNINLNK